MARKHLAIIGAGMAAARLLDDLIARGATRRYTITVFGEEPAACYNRILLSRVLAGDDPDAIAMKPADWYAASGAKLVSGVRVERLDTPARAVVTADGQRHPYDVAVLATGSAPFVPPIGNMRANNGSPKPGAFAYRTLDDCVRIRAAARAGDNAVVLGGGLLGLEAAKGLSDAGLHVTVVHLAATLMETQLDATAGEMLRRQIERCGIFVRTGRTIAAVTGDERVEGVRLDDGTVLAADLLVLACGIRPRADVAAAGGIPTRRGVLVNDTLATSVPGVYALGECAEHRGKVYGIVAPIWEQAEVLADVLSGSNPQARYRGSRLYTRLKVAGVEVASMGVIGPELESDEVVQVVEERKQAYRKLIVRANRLIGAMLVGDTEAAAALVQVFDRNDPLPENRLELLCAPAACASGPSSTRQICNCHRVSEAEIAVAVSAGADSLDALAQRTRAGTGCGSCRGHLVQIIARHKGQPRPRVAAEA